MKYWSIETVKLDKYHLTVQEGNSVKWMLFFLIELNIVS